jgi:hypothetical protein
MDVLVKNEEELKICQELFFTFGYTWPMNDRELCTSSDLLFFDENFDNGIVLSTITTPYGIKEFLFYSFIDIEPTDVILSFEELINILENDGFDGLLL